jgi:hypothetical protein
MRRNRDDQEEGADQVLCDLSDVLSTFFLASTEAILRIVFKEQNFEVSTSNAQLVYDPVVVHLFRPQAANPAASFTTVMNWQAHDPIKFNGVLYGQKDVEFGRFMSLPSRTTLPLEIAVFGKRIPTAQLIDDGWRIRNAHEVTLSFDSYAEYIRTSKGEFSVCKNVWLMCNYCAGCGILAL